MPTPKKILLVDDEADLASILSMRLIVCGYTVIVASNGEQALELAKREMPDLLVTDLLLPKINGYEVCRMLKMDDRFKQLPIIVTSALHEQPEREQAVESGADAYFVKPFDMGLFLVKVNELLH